MSDLAVLHEFLARRGIAHVVIGATALGVHGLLRATLDLDLLLVDREVLRESFWQPLRDSGWQVQVERGDDLDPLAGTVRVTAPGGSRPLDLVIGKHDWQRAIVGRGEPARIEGVELAVARAADLVLLKLDAGGPRDLWDIRGLLEVAGDPRSLRREVEAALGQLPAEARELWQQVSAED